MPGLARQLREAVIVNREFSGAGSYTELSLPEEVAALPQEVQLEGADGPIEGPEVESPELPLPAGTLLWFTERKVALLEVAGSGIIEEHPENFTLSQRQQ